MHRILSAALAVFIAAIFAAAPIGAGRADAQTERAATTPTNPRDGVRATPPGATLQEATNSISCNDANGNIRTYTVSVTAGVCTTSGIGSNRKVDCVGDGGDEASATCSRGCGMTTEQGSCTQTTN